MIIQTFMCGMITSTKSWSKLRHNYYRKDVDDDKLTCFWVDDPIIILILRMIKQFISQSTFLINENWSLRQIFHSLWNLTKQFYDQSNFFIAKEKYRIWQHFITKIPINTTVGYMKYRKKHVKDDFCHVKALAYILSHDKIFFQLHFGAFHIIHTIFCIDVRNKSRQKYESYFLNFGIKSILSELTEL